MISRVAESLIDSGRNRIDRIIKYEGKNISQSEATWQQGSATQR